MFKKVTKPAKATKKTQPAKAAKPAAEAALTGETAPAEGTARPAKPKAAAPVQKIPESPSGESKLQKSLRLSNDEVLAMAIRNILTKDEEM